MRHQPHLLISEPWADARLAVSNETQRHMERVLRVPTGATVSYTNGLGMVGSGTWSGTGVVRGAESHAQPAVPAVTLAVAAPKSKDRQRFIVEKSQELGVRRLVWITTQYGEGRPVTPSKMAAWSKGALEQSRGAWRMDIDASATLLDLADPVMLDPDATAPLSSMAMTAEITLVIGPEGGFSPEEIEAVPSRVSLPTNILRTDTAAVVAAAALLIR